MEELGGVQILDQNIGKEKWADACRKMWIEIFQDSEAYLEYYMSHMWKKNTVLIRTSGKKRLDAMLHLNPYVLQIGNRQEKRHYIVAVSTSKEVRGRGYMGELLRKMFVWLRSQGESWTYLMPAAEAIYLPYQFEPVYYVNSFQTRFLTERKRENGVQIRSFGTLTEIEKGQVADFADKMLRERFAVFSVHTVSYFQELMEQMKTYSGDLLIFFYETRVVGYTSYLYDGEEGEAEFIETVIVPDVGEEIFLELQNHILHRYAVSEMSVRFDESEFLTKQRKDGERRKEPPKCLTMVRILDFPKAAEQLVRPEGWQESCVLQIRDFLIPENEGNWRLIFSEGGTQVQATADAPDQIMEIQEFTSLWFAQHRVYLNDLI